MMVQLYLHFPFCKRKCFYCDFCSFPSGETEVEVYCGALIKEMELYAAAYPDATVDTVFLGGGTPSIVPAPQMDKVLAALKRNFSFAKQVEFTSEGNPGTLTDEWLDVISHRGVNRLSLGMQAKQNELLQSLGRIHTHAQTVEAVDMAKRHGFDNLNLDVMFGLPGQTVEDYLDTLRAAAELDAAHLSAYSLIVEEGTPLFSRVQSGIVKLPGEDAEDEMYEQGVDLMETMGYRQYEISNFAKPGFECRHNLGYWQGKYYLGLGLGAHGMLPCENAPYRRVENTYQMKDYLDALREGRLPRKVSTLVKRDEAMFETLMLGLRTLAGIDCAEFERRFGEPLDKKYGAELEKLAWEGLAVWDKRLRLTRRGLRVQNAVLLRLMDPQGKQV